MQVVEINYINSLTLSFVASYLIPLIKLFFNLVLHSFSVEYF